MKKYELATLAITIPFSYFFIHSPYLHLFSSVVTTVILFKLNKKIINTNVNKSIIFNCIFIIIWSFNMSFFDKPPYLNNYSKASTIIFLQIIWGAISWFNVFILFLNITKVFSSLTNNILEYHYFNIYQIFVQLVNKITFLINFIKRILLLLLLNLITFLNNIFKKSEKAFDLKNLINNLLTELRNKEASISTFQIY